jgi:hypothetical protein
VSCRSRVVLKTRVSCRANGPHALWTSIVLHPTSPAEQWPMAAGRIVATKTNGVGSGLHIRKEGDSRNRWTSGALGIMMNWSNG